MRQSFKYRLYPKNTQQQMMRTPWNRVAWLYHRLLAERQEAYDKSGKTLPYEAPVNRFPTRKDGTVQSQVLQDVAQRLDKAFLAFFRRVKNLEQPDDPRFKSVECFDHPQSLRKAECKLKRWQHAVSRQMKGSRRRAKAHENVAHQRRDTAHKRARPLVNAYQLIALEDLNTQGLLKNHLLAKSIACTIF